MIRCINVHKSYRSAAAGGLPVQALRGVDLSIDAPGFYGIMGASGSGKSTLLHLLAALDVPDAGEVFVAGQRLDTFDDRALTLFRRHQVGIIFQQFNLIPTMSARENVELPGLLAGRSEREVRQRSGMLLESLGLSSRTDHRPEALSGGEQQRIAIARALLFEPSVLLADEPTGNLDSRSSEALWSLLEELAAERKLTVVMVTHEPAAAAHCGRVFVMHDGRIVGDFETEGLDAVGVADRAQRLGR
ncbi:MAG: ABC transporter ATP-binding protein [Phycisphaerae bacterium]|nr:ABC transporter ATP-binding protein [Phycisphaerae bacterium]